jgi:hypothetical protein
MIRIQAIIPNSMTQMFLMGSRNGPIKATAMRHEQTPANQFRMQAMDIAHIRFEHWNFRG